jgi:NDP-sugar pyrophosphorylase family protein
MNGDLLTDFNFRTFMDAHLESDASVSVGVYYKQIPVSLGVLELDEHSRAIGFREKPVLSFPCSMGVYVIGPEIIPMIPHHRTFGFDDLMALCLSQKILVRAHTFDGLWLDIGRHEDYAEAAKLFHDHRARLFPPRIYPKPHAAGLAAHEAPRKALAI